jgi:2-polyprenyl-3-methyl-5-hydroxy-6-metoxy-1,4-benzoquinol methylase
MNASAFPSPNRAATAPQRCPAPCICCGSSEWMPWFRILSRCRACGFIRADLDLSPVEIKRLYQEDYFRGEEYGDYLADHVSHVKNFAHRFQAMKAIAPELHTLFEVGCAYGFWLAECSRNGLSCSGVDVCPEAVEHAVHTLGQKASAEDFLDLRLPTGHYQAFCLWDTIEHLAHPELFLKRIHALLPDDGWVFLTTGDIGSRMARFRGPHWRMIHPPTHLQYFSQQSMTQFLTHHGFRVVRCQSTPMYRNIGEVLRRLATLGKGATRWLAACLERVLPQFIQRGGFWLDLGDIMFVAARKVR